MLHETTGASEAKAVAVLNGDELRSLQQLVRRLPIGESVIEAILNLVRSARPGEIKEKRLADVIAWGPGPRASQALMLAVRARALLDRRLAPAVEDVLALAGPVLRHRMAVTFAARAEGVTIDDVVGRLVRHVS